MNQRVNAKVGVSEEGQRLGTPIAVRVCTGSRSKSLRAQRQIQGAQRVQGPQAIHCGAGEQNAAHNVHDALQKHPLRGQNGGLRGLDGGAQRTTMVADTG